jgi:hypothetical protein
MESTLHNRRDDAMNRCYAENEDSYEILDRFFCDTNLKEVGTLFDKIFETCLTADDGPFSKGEARGNLLCMRRKIEEVLGACYRIAGEKGE